MMGPQVFGRIENGRCIDDFNFNWKFSKDDVAESAFEVSFDDADWKALRVPHDWSAEESFTQDNTAPETASLPGGVGWYRKTFRMSKTAEGDITSILFDGVYTNSEVWINGHYLGVKRYGYISFAYDLTPFLNYGDKENTIAVKVDHSAYHDCRWYPGSGIYRNVKLVTTRSVYIPRHGICLTTPEVSVDSATVLVDVSIADVSEITGECTVVATIIDSADQVIAQSEAFVTGESAVAGLTCVVAKPQLWSPDSPSLYTVVSQIYKDGDLLDSVVTTFGIRYFHYDKDLGFFLNGENTFFKGVCLHHDGGCVGAAVPDDVWRRRLLKLKSCGVNAIRTAHNPPSVEFLDMCDEIGFLVQDEAFDEFDNPKDKKHNFKLQGGLPDECRGYPEYFNECAEDDLKEMVLRDRNHPSIVMWSIGNEVEWTYPVYEDATGYWNDENDADYYYNEPPYDIKKIKTLFADGEHGPHDLAKTVQDLSRWVKDIDTTRPVTANLVIPAVSYFSGYTDALDIVGLSYRQIVYDYCRRNYPGKPMFGSENWGHWHEWKPVLENDYMPGIFLWTGIDYLGESHDWPKKGAAIGLLDFAGFEKAGYHMFKTLWQEKSHVYMTTKKLDESAYQWSEDKSQVICREGHEWNKRQWDWQPVEHHWNYENGDEVAVEVYTNAPEGELFLNGESCGKVALVDCDDLTLKWIIPFAEGELVAKAYNADGSVSEHLLSTCGKASALDISVDRNEIAANCYDVVHVEVQLKDGDGTPVEVDDQFVTFAVDGDCRFLGVDHGSAVITNDNLSESCKTNAGRCLLVLQANDKPGSVTVTASLENGVDNSISFDIR